MINQLDLASEDYQDLHVNIPSRPGWNILTASTIGPCGSLHCLNHALAGRSQNPACPLGRLPSPKSIGAAVELMSPTTMTSRPSSTRPFSSFCDELHNQPQSFQSRLLSFKCKIYLKSCKRSASRTRCQSLGCCRRTMSSKRVNPLKVHQSSDWPAYRMIS